MLEIGSCVVVQKQLVSLWMPIWIFNSPVVAFGSVYSC